LYKKNVWFLHEPDSALEEGDDRPDTSRKQIIYHPALFSVYCKWY